MKNRAVLNLMFTAFALVFCAGLFSLSAKGSDTDALSGDDSQELRLREDTAVREANDAALAEIENIKAVRRTRYIDEELGYVPDVNLVSSDELDAIETERAEKEKAVRARFGYDINSLEQEQAAMPQGQTAGSRRAEVRPSVSAPAVVRGTVTGIVLYNNKGAALIAGEIVRQNDTLMGVKVVRIMPDYVEFNKNGKTWKQEVGQPPPVSIWEPPASPVKPASPAQRPSTTSNTKPGR
jgi:hypothetical protein